MMRHAPKLFRGIGILLLLLAACWIWIAEFTTYRHHFAPAMLSLSAMAIVFGALFLTVSTIAIAISGLVALIFAAFMIYCAFSITGETPVVFILAGVAGFL